MLSQKSKNIIAIQTKSHKRQPDFLPHLLTSLTILFYGTKNIYLSSTRIMYFLGLFDSLQQLNIYDVLDSIDLVEVELL